jgi:hypothetical protein
MRQWLRSHLTYANVISTLSLFLVLGGGTALAAYVVGSNAQIGPGTVSGHKPPSGDHANIIAGSVNGQDVADNSLAGADILESSLTGDVQHLIYTASASSNPAPITKIATVGPYTISGQCLGFNAGGGLFVNVRIHVKGPSGTADSLWSQTQNDNADGGTHSTGLLIPSNTDLQIVDIGSGPGNYVRGGGTSMLRTGSTLVQVDFDAVGDGRSSGSCFIYGTATRAT